MAVIQALASWTAMRDYTVLSIFPKKWWQVYRYRQCECAYAAELRETGSSGISAFDGQGVSDWGVDISAFLP